MTKEPRIFFHLGLQKTGSTFLQRAIFPNLKGILYFRKSRYKFRNRIVSENPDQKILFTNELDTELLPGIKEVSSEYPDAGTILILRRQDSWIRSKYHYHIRKHGFMSFREFFDLDSNDAYWKKEHFFFQPKVQWMMEHFEREPLILIYDDLKEDSAAYIKQFTDYLGEGVYVSDKANLNKVYKPAFSPKVNTILKKFNRWYRYEKATTSSRFLNKVHYKYREFLLHIVAFFGRFIPQAWVKKEVHIPPEELAKIREYYREDWEACVAHNRAFWAKR